MIGRTAFLCAWLAGLAGLAGAFPGDEKTVIRPDSMALLLGEFGRKTDSLTTALAAWPVKPEPPEACVTDAAALCAKDKQALDTVFRQGRAIGKYLESHGYGSLIGREAYADTLVPWVKDFAGKRLAPSGAALQTSIAMSFDTVYTRCIANPVLLRKFVDVTVPSRILMERKYLSGDEANLLEGYLNGHLHFTRTDPDPTKPNFGVSPWEFLFRFEPIYMAYEPEVENLGVLLDVGLLRHFLPVAGATAGTLEETFASRWLRRLGLKLGGGFYSDEFNWVAGGAVQVSALSGWVLYDWEREQIGFAVGVTDLSLFEKYLPILGSH